MSPEEIEAMVKKEIAEKADEDWETRNVAENTEQTVNEPDPGK